MNDDQSDTNETLSDRLSLPAQIEAVLFVASEPVSINRLADSLGITAGAARKAIHSLDESCADRGIRLQWVDGGVQFTSAPEASRPVETFLGLETPVTRLSPAALEVLSIVAYLQPITRPQIDEVRGVNSDGSLRTLISKGLLEEVGRLDGPGRPILYGTTPQFMQQFGLSNMDELPAIEVEAEPETEEPETITQS